MIKPINVVCLIFILTCACNNSGKKRRAAALQNDTPSNPVNRKVTFFDSIMSQAEIPVAQLKRHLLDTGYFTGRTHFAGDTVYYPNSDYPLVILSMDSHGVCLEKYLLVYKKNSLKNIACLQVESDCDIDYGEPYNKLDYKVFSKNQFFTRDVWYEVDKASKVKITKTEQFYQVNANGKIDSLKKKPAGLVLPEFVPIDVTDDDK